MNDNQYPQPEPYRPEPMTPAEFEAIKNRTQVFVLADHEQLTQLKRDHERLIAVVEALDEECERLALKRSEEEFEASLREFSMQIRDGKFDAHLRTVFTMPMASMAARVFDIDGGINYASYEFHAEDGRRFEMIVKPLEGKMPAFVAAEWREKFHAAEREVGELKERVGVCEGKLATAEYEKRRFCTALYDASIELRKGNAERAREIMKAAGVFGTASLQKTE